MFMTEGLEALARDGSLCSPLTSSCLTKQVCTESSAHSVGEFLQGFCHILFVSLCFVPSESNDLPHRF